MVDRTQLEALIAANTVVGIVRGKRLRFVQLLVPPDVAFRALGERPRGGVWRPWEFTYREDLGRTRLTVLKKYHPASGAFVLWGAGKGFPPDRSVPNAEPGNGAKRPLRPPIRRGGEHD